MSQTPASGLAARSMLLATSIRRSALSGRVASTYESASGPEGELLHQALDACGRLLDVAPGSGQYLAE